MLTAGVGATPSSYLKGEFRPVHDIQGQWVGVDEKRAKGRVLKLCVPGECHVFLTVADGETDRRFSEANIQLLPLAPVPTPPEHIRMIFKCLPSSHLHESLGTEGSSTI